MPAQIIVSSRHAAAAELLQGLVESAAVQQQAIRWTAGEAGHGLGDSQIL
jgi:hypothetical protein